uniref:Uncharacterized protein n=1 Tax=Neisseria meningitidis alpha153 TaxID=663926 RepID=C6SG63_NEIME|nr:hypothetical protein predicted by Glimmer/Critica [Neisseria meningitidis alpha153]
MRRNPYFFKQSKPSCLNVSIKGLPSRVRQSNPQASNFLIFL